MWEAGRWGSKSGASVRAGPSPARSLESTYSVSDWGPGDWRPGPSPGIYRHRAMRDQVPGGEVLAQGHDRHEAHDADEGEERLHSAHGEAPKSEALLDAGRRAVRAPFCARASVGAAQKRRTIKPSLATLAPSS